MLEKLSEQLRTLDHGRAVAAVALAAVILIWFLWRLFVQRKGEAAAAVQIVGIDVAELGEAGPPDKGGILEYYYTPVRLAAIVVAPADRAGELPPPDELAPLYDEIVPGLAEIVAEQQPLVRRWPAQLSVSGFGNTFFRHVPLPGDGGKGTVWASAAGMARFEGQPVMVGFVFRSAVTNQHGHEIIPSEEHWLRVLGIKSRE